MFECKVLEFPSYAGHTQPMSDRRVHIKGLLSDSPSLFARQVLKGAHVVKPVSELDQNHPYVVDHRQQHLSHVECLAFFSRSMVELRYLCKPVNKMGDFGPEVFLDLLG